MNTAPLPHDRRQVPVKTARRKGRVWWWAAGLAVFVGVFAAAFAVGARQVAANRERLAVKMLERCLDEWVRGVPAREFETRHPSVTFSDGDRTYMRPTGYALGRLERLPKRGEYRIPVVFSYPAEDETKRYTLSFYNLKRGPEWIIAHQEDDQAEDRTGTLAATRKVVLSMLESWKRGETPEAWCASNPAVGFLYSSQWVMSRRLLTYRIVSEKKSPGRGYVFEVALGIQYHDEARSLTAWINIHKERLLHKPGHWTVTMLSPDK